MDSDVDMNSDKDMNRNELGIETYSCAFHPTTKKAKEAYANLKSSKSTKDFIVARLGLSKGMWASESSVG